MNALISVMNTIFETEYEGIIYINEERKINHFSYYAKKITGVILEEEKEHPAGNIEEGDIVIIADNEIGNDDKLNLRILSSLNIKDEHISIGDAFVAVGVYGNKKIQPEYKFLKSHNPNGKLKLSTNYMGFNIESEVDFADNLTAIKVNGESYNMKYFESVGNMVVIDSTSGTVKFFQAKGYGYRKEEIGQLLKGESFKQKINEYENEPNLNIEYKKVFTDKEFCRKIDEMYMAEDFYWDKGIYEIYRRPFFCTFLRLIDEHTGYSGVYIIIQDETSVEALCKDRNEIIKALQKRKKDCTKLESESENIDKLDFIGVDPSMKEVKMLAVKAANTKFNVIITGESGTGKSRLAREIHNMGKQKGDFIEVNCNAIAPTLFESELFGYVGGAFTGASSGGKKGFFREAEGGTIFLDEIGDMPLEFQVKLLHVLQNKKFYPVGSSKPVEVDCRIIVATNKDLEEEVKEGRFRQDLYYRINVFPINIPPLRNRNQDLYIMINDIVKGLCEKYEMKRKLVSQEALEIMLRYSWPGNVRELENILERAVILCEGSVIYSEYILINDNETYLTLKERLQKEEVKIILETLLRNGKNKQKTMQELNISKTAFYEKLNKYNLL